MSHNVPCDIAASCLNPNPNRPARRSAIISTMNYDQLLGNLTETAVLGSTGNLLSWDELTYMPEKGAPARAKQSSLIARLVHERFTAREVGDSLESLSRQPLNDDAAANVREWLRQYRRAVRIPASLVEEISRVAVHARQAWGEAKEKSQFATFAPWLQKTIDLQRQAARCLAGSETASGQQLYDALLDGYEPYETCEHLRQVFSQLRPRLVDLVRRVTATGRPAPVEILQRSYDTTRQREFAQSVATRIGFDFSAGRLDTTLHPFCNTIAPGDVRLTTRYDEHDFGNCFFSVIHEMGHGLYEQGLPARHWGTPLGEAVSLGVHESQSRLWENLVARSDAFWRGQWPNLQAAFPSALTDVSRNDFVRAVNAIRPSLIRTEADEATYNLHIMLRFELEQALLTGDLPVADLPSQWNQRMKEYLGIDVPDDRHGCLQDVHWSQGAIGYFPTYTLGNLHAAALFEAAGRDLPTLEADIERADFAPLLAWLRDRVHRHGQRFRARDLIRQATGQDLSIEPLMRHLEHKANAT